MKNSFFKELALCLSLVSLAISAKTNLKSSPESDKNIEDGGSMQTQSKNGNSRYSPVDNSYYSYATYPSSLSSAYHQKHAANLLYQDYDRVGREYAAAASTNIGYSTAPDLLAQAGGHGHSQEEHSGGGGGGHGHGHGGGGHHHVSYGGHGHGHHSKVSNTGIGLLGLIGLLSLLQGVLAAITALATTTAAGRKKREVSAEGLGIFDNKKRLTEKITLLVLPNFNVIAHIRDGKFPLECSAHEVCSASKIFREELGESGALVGKKLNGAILKLLKPVEVEVGFRSGNYNLTRSLEDALESGQNGKNCSVTHPICREMRMGVNGEILRPALLLPQNILLKK